MTKERLFSRVEVGDLVIYFGSEWTVHTVDERTALLRKHPDVDATDTTIRVDRSSIRPFKTAAER